MTRRLHTHVAGAENRSRYHATLMEISGMSVDETRAGSSLLGIANAKGKVANCFSSAARTSRENQPLMKHPAL